MNEKKAYNRVLCLIRSGLTISERPKFNDGRYTKGFRDCLEILGEFIHEYKEEV